MTVYDRGRAGKIMCDVTVTHLIFLSCIEKLKLNSVRFIFCCDTCIQQMSERYIICYMQFHIPINFRPWVRVRVMVRVRLDLGLGSR